MFSIKHNDELIAIVGNSNDFKKGWTFSPYPDEPLQWGIGLFKKDYTAQRHIHLSRERIPKHPTQEFFYIVDGKVGFELYSADKEFAGYFELTKGDFICVYHGGHGMTILQEDTKILEIKNGAFVGVEKDKEKF
jgi:hypothetical protein